MRRTLAFLLATAAAPALAEMPPGVSHFTLDNGLEAVVIEDHRAPVVVQMLWYRIGSADEVPGKSGLAHYLEHLMFKGTEKLAPGELSKTVTANGGMDNAFTSYDFTTYFQRIASDRLDLVMGMEADRMANLRIGEDDWQAERQVVLEERAQRTDSDPRALFSEERSAVQYYNHPYGRPVIGWRQEMEALTREDALKWYDDHYAPNVAVLVVAGDVTADEVRALAEKHYGPIPPKPEAPRGTRPQEPEQRAARRMTMTDPRVPQPVLTRSVIVPERNAGDQKTAAALSVLAELLGGSPQTSFLGQRLVLTGKALGVGAWYDGLSVDPTTFAVTMAYAPGTDDAAAEAALDEAIRDFLAQGPDPAHLERVKTQLRAARIYERDSAHGRAYDYGQGLAVGLTVEDVNDWPDILAQVTVEDVRAAAELALDSRAGVTSLLKPGGAGMMQATADGAETATVSGDAAGGPPPAPGDAASAAELPGDADGPEALSDSLSPAATAPDVSADAPVPADTPHPAQPAPASPAPPGGQVRSRAFPGPGADPMIRSFLSALALTLLAALPARAIDIQEVTSPGGITAWLVEDDSIPFVAVEIAFRGGASVDAPGKRGAINLMTALLEEGAGERDAVGFAQALEELAASASFDVSDDALSVSFRALTENRDQAADLLADALARPRFDADALERVRAQVQSSIRAQDSDPQGIASKEMARRAWGDHPYGSVISGTEESVAALTRDDLLAAKDRVLARDRVLVSAAGDIDPQALGLLIDRILGDLPAQATAPLPPKAQLKLTGASTVIDWDSPQTVVSFAQAGLPMDHPDYFAAFVLNHILGGGGFSSRLMEEIREKRGLTYGVGTELSNMVLGETWAGGMATANDRTAEAVALVREVWGSMREGVTEQELRDAKTYLTGEYPLRFDGNRRIAGILSGMQLMGMPRDYVNTRNARIEAVTAEDVRRVAQEVLDPAKLEFVLVGRPQGM